MDEIEPAILNWRVSYDPYGRTGGGEGPVVSYLSEFADISSLRITNTVGTQLPNSTNVAIVVSSTKSESDRGGYSTT